MLPQNAPDFHESHEKTEQNNSLKDKGRNQWEMQLSGAGRDHVTKGHTSTLIVLEEPFHFAN